MKTVIIDLDGICFDCTRRLERCTKADGMLDWDKAFSNKEVEQDDSIPGADVAVRKIAKVFSIVYLTGRSRKCQIATWNMLFDDCFPIPLMARVSAPSVRLEMRDYDDIRPDSIVKQERILWMRTLPLCEQESYDFVAAIDDNYSGTLKPMYESLGIPCFTSFKKFFRSEIWKQK